MLWSAAMDSNGNKLRVIYIIRNKDCDKEDEKEKEKHRVRGKQVREREREREREQRWRAALESSGCPETQTSLSCC